MHLYVYISELIPFITYTYMYACGYVCVFDTPLLQISDSMKFIR